MTSTKTTSDTTGVTVKGDISPGFEEILSADALGFVASLTREFGDALRDLLAARQRLGSRRTDRAGLDFPGETHTLRNSDWKVAPIPRDLEKRVVEITGPVDRKMVINALNSGADVFMADFEDSCSPTWHNIVGGQLNLRDAVRREIEFEAPGTGKQYSLNDDIATLLVRPRGLHLVERHVEFEDNPVPASLFDFGLYLFHNVHELMSRGTGPYFYLPKLESRYEARWWNDVFIRAQELLGLSRGTIKATVLIETLPAAFEMDEILFELREHSAGLNCGRWDYIFSFIKTQRNDPNALLPDRSQVTMEQPCMRAYTQLAIKTCHRRGIHAIGGMAAQIPIKNDPDANETALSKVRADKLREVTDGHDGTWVAHPGLVAVAREMFESEMKGPNQLHRLREDVNVSAEDLLQVPSGTRTEAGLRLNVRVGIEYLAAWLSGNGCVPLYNLMEDAATAEISRTQVWQWIRHGATLDDGRVIDTELVRSIVDSEMEDLKEKLGQLFEDGRYEEAARLFYNLSVAGECAEFLTIPAYDML